MLILQVIQILVSVLVIGAILIQAKGVGLSSTFGGGGEFYKSKRGVEKFVFRATVVLGVCFFVSSLLLFVAS